MELTRRGFFGLLAGAVLGKIIGPRVIAPLGEPSWNAAVRAKPFPVENTYLTLEQICRQVLDTMDKELRFLKVERMNTDSMYSWDPVRLGETVRYRRPVPFTPDLSISPLSYESMNLVTLNRAVHSGFRVDPDWPHAWKELSANIVQPVAYGLAEQIIWDCRRMGGAEILCVGTLEHRPEFSRSVIAANPESGLSLRAVEYLDAPPSLPPWDRPERHVRFDLLYGLA